MTQKLASQDTVSARWGHERDMGNETHVHRAALSTKMAILS